MLRTITRLALSLAIAFASGCGDGASGARPDAAVVAPDAGLAEVIFRVHVPDTTPAGATISIAGNFQGWDPAAPAYRLPEIAPLTYELRLSFALGTQLEFKVTRGSWETVEKGPRGEDIQNRTIEVLAPTILELTVGSWADQSASTVVGDVTTITVPGFLGARRVWIYLPPGYHVSTASYPVLYMLDGQNLFDRVTSFAGEWRIDETLEALIPAGQVAPIVVVGIDNGGSSRIDEYTPWLDSGEGRGGGADAHLTAIGDVLMPYIDATYRVRTGPASTAIGGSSLGGLMTLYAVYARRDLFGAGAAVSPSIWWADRRIVTFAAGSTRPAARVWMDMGTAEYSSGIADLHRMRDAMVAQGFVLGTDLEVVEDPDAGHNEAAWSRRFPDIVRYLFPPP